ncbi:MAG: autotransporter domain-containing protein [Proteobacteria bacterium]|nr:autotransporter domain-containing protein [Pseudomonadota bacterium]
MSKGSTYAKTPSLQRLALVAMTIVASAALSASMAQGASFEIADGETVTAPQTLNDNETGTINTGGQLNTATTAVAASGINNTVDNGGIISTTDNNAHGIDSTGDNATISNSGTINTEGWFAYGIHSNGTAATIFNNGTISTTGAAAYGIVSDRTATISNTGTISLTGAQTLGIESQGFYDSISNSGTISITGSRNLGIHSVNSHGATISNSGTISTTGADGSGFSVGIALENSSSSTISNTGSISATGYRSRGIDLYSSGTAIVNNSGNISAAGIDSSGIEVRAFSPNTTIINSGAIFASGVNAHGIYITAATSPNTTITNSGLISATGTNSYAIEGNTNTTLNLLPGSRIIGRIDLGDNGGDLDTANIHGSFGSAVLTFENTEAINLYTDNAVKIGNTVVVVEPTGESARAVTLNTLASGVHQVIGRRMQTTPAKEPIQLAALTLSPGMLHQERQPMAWGQVFGSTGERGQEGQMLAYDSHLGGVVIGYEQDFGKSRVGLLVGAATGTTETTMIDTDTDTVFLGVYGHFFLGPVNLTASLIGGNEAHDTSRQVLDNLNGYEIATSNTDSYFISPSLTLGSSYVLTPKVALRPSATVTYSKGYYNGYDETGTTNANLQADSRTVQAISTRLQLEVAQRVAAGEVSLRAGIQTRHTDSGTIEMHLGGSDFRFNAAGDENVAGGFLGCGTNLLLSDRLSLVADAEFGRMSGDETQVAGQVTLQYQF